LRPEPLRYSADLVYVRRTHSGIKPYLTALRDIATRAGLIEHGSHQSGQMVHIVFDAPATASNQRIRVKIETNITETESFLPHITLRYAVASPWWSGTADVSTFQLEELMATKLRALYQRRKGRDLFDLWHVLSDRDIEPELIVDGLTYYMGDHAFGDREFSANLAAKLQHHEFLSDTDQLISESSAGYNPTAAADLVVERLGSLLDGAPELELIEDGNWRAST
jgi:predicted nucleotidyltransferase component of viral defense system